MSHCMSLLPWFLLWLRGWFGGFVWCFGRVFAAAVRNAQVRHTPHPTAVCMPKRKGPQFLPRVDLAAADALVAQAHGAPVAANPTGLIAHAPRKVQALSGASTPVAPTFVRPGRSSRGDVAVIKDHTRASFEVALRAAEDIHDFESALEALDKDMFSATSAGPRRAVMATYYKLHRAANGDSVPVLPLTASAVKKTAALFKAGGYKSYRNYISRVREDHIAAGYDISAQVDQMIRLCKKSVVRGLAGAVRSEPFSFEAVCTVLGDRILPIAAGGPHFPLALFVLATLFLLRELEAASATWADIVLNEVAETVTLTLPSSKTDWAAKGCRRTWGCTCSLGKPCAYHVAVRYRELAARHGSLDGPLFVDRAGNGCTKAAIVETLRAAIKLTGQPVVDQTGKHLYSGHAFRITHCLPGASTPSRFSF